MIKCIATDESINDLGDLAFKCPVCGQVYAVEPTRNYGSEYQEFACYECGSVIGVEVTSTPTYNVKINAVKW